MSGFSAEELFERGVGITYDDFTLLDTILTVITRDNISLKTNLGKGISLQVPIIASPMDTVTNAELCIALALEGGIGGIHYNYKFPDGTPDLDAQQKEVERVKRFKNGFIENPIVLAPNQTIEDAIKIGQKNMVGTSPISTFPVTYRGAPHGKLLGLLRKQDYSFTNHTQSRVKDRMLPLEKLISAEWPLTLDQANKMLWEEHLLFLPIVNKNGRLKYLITRSDIDKNEKYPLATKDDKERLQVLFAVETWPNPAYERLERCFDAGADGCIIDTSQGNTVHEVSMIKYILKKYPNKLVIGGNISTLEAYQTLSDAGLKAYRCGQGSGSICTTAGAIGIARAGAAGIYHTAKSEGNAIADGGLREVGDIVKALTIGADVVMLGNMLAGTEESPGETIIDPQSGLQIKVYRGMGSKEASAGKARGYSRLPQGVSSSVQYRGSVHSWIPLIKDGILSALESLNCQSIPELHKKMYSGDIRFEKRTVGSLQESRPHSLNH